VRPTCFSTAPVLAATSCQGTRLLWCSATLRITYGCVGVSGRGSNHIC
jgi:hypothetical protein